MNGEVCAAHSVLIDNMAYIRNKQDETALITQNILLGQSELKMTIAQVQAAQVRILAMDKRRKWTPAKVITLAAALFGSGSAFPMFISMVVSWIR